MNSNSENDFDGEIQATGNQVAAEPVETSKLEANEVISLEAISLIANLEVETPNPQLSEYEFVADLLRRQDEVLNALDDLNVRIESAISEISAARQAEMEAANPVEKSESDSDPSEVAPASKAA